MMDAVAMLDRQVARVGQMITLVRSTPAATLDVMAFVTTDGAREFMGGIMQGDVKIIVSPSVLITAPWDATATDPRRVLPTDKVIVQGRQRQIIAILPQFFLADLVRLELQVRG